MFCFFHPQRYKPEWKGGRFGHQLCWQGEACEYILAGERQPQRLHSTSLHLNSTFLERDERSFSIIPSDWNPPG